MNSASAPGLTDNTPVLLVTIGSATRIAFDLVISIPDIHQMPGRIGAMIATLIGLGNDKWRLETAKGNGCEWLAATER